MIEIIKNALGDSVDQSPGVVVIQTDDCIVGCIL